MSGHIINTFLITTTITSFYFYTRWTENGWLNKLIKGGLLLQSIIGVLLVLISLDILKATLV